MVSRCDNGFKAEAFGPLAQNRSRQGSFHLVFHATGLDNLQGLQKGVVGNRDGFLKGLHFPLAFDGAQAVQGRGGSMITVQGKIVGEAAGQPLGGGSNRGGRGPVVFVQSQVEIAGVFGLGPQNSFKILFPQDLGDAR